jgi:hypothetical protein
MTHERYEWLDHARGIVVLMYVVSMVLAALDGNVVLGERPLGPTYFNHGYAYFNGIPAMITLIDTGQMLFIFVLGFVGYLAFAGRWEKRGPVSAWLYALRRFGGLYGLSILYEVVISPLIGESRNWGLALYDGVLARLALGALAAYVAIYFMRNADWRMAVAIVFLIIHAFFYASYAFDRYPWFDDIMKLPKFPFGVWNMAGVAIAGSACGQWLKRDPGDPKAGFRDRIVPMGVMALVAAYCMEWLQPSEHHDVTTALALLSIGLSTQMLATCYAFNEFGWGISILRPLGRNLLLLFVVTAIFVDMYAGWVADNLLPMHPYGTLLLLGIVPVGAIMLLAVLLEKWNIVVRL